MANANPKDKVTRLRAEGSAASVIESSGGDGGGGLDARVAKLESDIDHLDRSLSLLRNLAAGGLAIVLGALGGGFLYLAGRSDALNQRLDAASDKISETNNRVGDVRIVVERIATVQESQATSLRDYVSAQEKEKKGE